MFQNKKIKIIVIPIVLIVLIGGALYYFQTEYGIFYSKEKKQQISEEFVKKSEVFMEKTFPADFPKAEKMAIKALRFNKENIESYILLAKTLYAQERLEEAKGIYLRGLEIDPENFKMNFYLGNVLRDLGEHDLAEEYYKKALEIDPHDITCWINYAIFYSFDKKDWAGAARVYEEALKANPDNEQLKSLYEGAKQNAGLE
jgi:tetratricopeptide (TPR) repeat protein